MHRLLLNSTICFWKTKMFDMKEKNISNCDQTNTDFDEATWYNIAERGSKTITSKGSDSSSLATVMFCCCKTEKALPFVIFKGVYTNYGQVKKELLARVGFPESCFPYGKQRLGSTKG